MWSSFYVVGRFLFGSYSIDPVLLTCLRFTLAFLGILVFTDVYFMSFSRQQRIMNTIHYEAIIGIRGGITDEYGKDIQPGNKSSQLVERDKRFAVALSYGNRADKQASRCHGIGRSEYGYPVRFSLQVGLSAGYGKNPWLPGAGAPES